jgi:hypothetical protein
LLGVGIPLPLRLTVRFERGLDEMKQPALIAGSAFLNCQQRSLAENNKTVPKLHKSLVGNELKLYLGPRP